ncbi:MAG: DMT family transporter, partial [Solobacterium sp.]|nr:DMT family transporter [Solobacterium sp.]
IHILVIDHFAPHVDAAKFSAVQFLAAGIFGLIGTALFEAPSIAGIEQAMIPILYAGVFSAGLGYTLQTYGQKGAEPSEASVLLSLESVFSAPAGFVILHETLSVRELCGCALMFAAVLLSQKQ